MFIGNEEVVCDKEFTITEEMLSTSSTILNNCYPKSWEENHDYVNNFYYPEDYSKCRIYKDNKLIFCGIVRNTGNISLNPREPKYCSLQILDFKDFLSNGETLDFVIVNKTIEEAINLIVETVSDYGVVVGDINILNSQDVIGAYSTLDKTPYDVFQYLAEISNSRWKTHMVDENTIAVDFYDPSLMPEGSEIKYTDKWFDENDIIDMKYNYNTQDYRNKQIMTSDEVFANINQTETKISDGYNTEFTMGQKIGIINSISVDGIDKTFATNAEKDAGIIADFYYTSTENILSANDIYSPGLEITINYTPIVKGRQIIYNNNEINRIENQINRKGIISRYENRNDATSSYELQKIGNSYIKYKGVAEITLTIQSRNDLWNVGETVNFSNAPLNELSTNYMVKKKTMQIITTTDMTFYTYELTSSYNSESAINYFDNQRNKAKGNISEGQYIARNIDVENVSNLIFYDASIEEVQVQNPTSLDFELDGVLI
jgi:hypothetical protein